MYHLYVTTDKDAFIIKEDHTRTWCQS